MYFEDEPEREDYSLEDDNLEDIEEEKLEGEIVVEDHLEETSEKIPEAEDEPEDKIEVSDEPEMRKIPEDTEIDSEASEDTPEGSPEVMIRSPVLASKTESEPNGKSKFFTELGDFEEIKIGKLDGNSGNLATFFYDESIEHDATVYYHRYISGKLI